jgi:hypothetical protein
MGFFDTVGDIAKGAAQGMIEKGNEMKEIKQKFDNYSDDKLAEICENDSFIGGSSSIEKSIAKKILSDRGYSL